MTDYIFEIIVSCITAVAVFFTGLINHIWKTEQQKNITDNNKMAQRLEVLESAPQHCGRGDRYEVRMSDIEKETSQLSHAQDLFCKKLDVLSKEITAMVKDQKEISKQLDKITMWIEFKEKEEKKKEQRHEGKNGYQTQIKNMAEKLDKLISALAKRAK